MTATLQRPEPTSPAEVEEAVARLHARKDDWVRVDLPRRAAYLADCIRGVREVSEEWVRLSCLAKGIDPASPLAGEEWLSGPTATIRILRLLRGALRRGGAPRPPSVRRAASGQAIVTVMPDGLLDRLTFPGITAEVWIEPGKEASQGRIYRDKAAGRFPPGRVGLVLGAGNISAIPPTDVAHKLFVDDEVVVLKMNPVNDYLGPLLARAFRSLVADGFLAVVQGGGEIGARLCEDRLVATLHLTGSDATHDAIVWGRDPDERRRRKAAGEPLQRKPFTSELGCVTPVLVAPGPWTEPDLDFQARHVAGMVVHNASHNCNAAQVVVLARGWDRAQRFLDLLGEHLGRIPPRRAYYPGALERYRELLARYPGAVPPAGVDGDRIPWTLIRDVPADGREDLLTREAFCGVLASVSLEAGDAGSFLAEAASFANETLWGNLSCVLLAHPATARAHGDALEAALAALRYGDIGLNVWSGVLFVLGVTTWGAYPGNRPEAIASGRGAVHNTFLFDHPQKSIVRAPFRMWPKPVWFPGHRSLDVVGRRLTAFEAAPSLARLPGLLAAAVRG